MSEFAPRPIERGIKQEELQITPEFIYNDNHSTQAQQNREQWEDIRRKGKLTAYYRCSDARLRPAGIGAVSWGSIAGADEPDMKFAASRGIGAEIILGHFDGDTVIKGEVPNGCGGLNAKKEIGNKKEQHGIKKYVSETVKHEDVLIQAWNSAENVAMIGGKPTLAALQDHLTLQMYPIALFTPQENGEMLIRSKVRIKDTLATNYDPKRIYENGIPAISESSLPDVFAEIMQQNMKDIQEINLKYPDLRKLQKVQKPRTIHFSTDIRSVRAKYPTLSSIPGSVFKVIVPRGKVEGNIQISKEDLENSLNQLEYPITHAVENYENPDKAFSNTDRLIIETGNIDLSKEVARKALEKDWMKEWLDLNDKKIILVQSTAGIISDIQYYTDQPRIKGI